MFGYVLECIYSSIIEKRINLGRGFFIGPYCPIYGITLLVINSFGYLNDIYLLLLSSIFISLIEYNTSYVLEKIFNRNWWDYSRKKYNIKGRVCLENVIIFSFGSVFIIRKIIPCLDNILGIENYFMIIITFILFIIFSIDLSLSLKRHYENTKGL